MNKFNQISIIIFLIIFIFNGCNNPNEIEDIYGCMDVNACNYDDAATTENNQCEYLIDCNGVCGGNSIDIDNDGICDNVDDCVTIDDCGNCQNQNISYVEMFDNCYSISTEQLDFSNLNINELPSQIGLLTQLEILDLSFNNLSILPSSISNLSNLKELNLSSNSFQTLPTYLDNLELLENLYLSFNQLDTLSSIFELTNLKKLDLNFNYLDTLSSDIGNLINLDILNLQNNELVYLPATMCSFSQNCYIVVSGNNLCEKYKHDCFDWGFNDIYWGFQDCNDWNLNPKLNL